MWLTQLKTALILEEVERLNLLVNEMPQFDSLAEMEEAAFLLHQTKELMERKKSQTARTMQQLKSTLEFLESTHVPPSSSINLKF